MDRQKLFSVANIVDAKGLHSIAREIEDIACKMGGEIESKTPLEHNISYYINPLEGLVRVADTLDKQGHKEVANDLDKIIEIEALECQSAIDSVLSIYKKKHNLASACGFCKRAVIRKDDLGPQACPYGLPIPQACQAAGISIQDMDARKVEFKQNLRIFNKAKTGKPCPFASQILEEKKAVNCNYGTEVAGKATPKMFRGSPIYPRLFEGFNTINLDRNYFQYHDFSYNSLYG